MDQTSSPRKARAVRTLSLAALASLSLAAPGMAETLRYIGSHEVPATPGMSLQLGSVGPKLSLSGPVSTSSLLSLADHGTAGSSTGGGLEASLTWAGGTGVFSNAANWSPSQAPVAGDDLSFPTGASDYTATNDTALAYNNVTTVSTGAGVPTITGGLTAATFQVPAGTATVGAGNYFLTSTNNPGTGGPVTNTATSITAGLGSGQTGVLNINGGAVVEYTQAYAGMNVGSNGTLNISGAGTIVRPNATTGAGNGRFGSIAGTGTINISDNAVVQARLYEIGRQNSPTVGARNLVTVNLSSGGSITTFNTASQILMSRGTNVDSVINVNAGGSINMPNVFVGVDSAGSTAVMNVSGANALVTVTEPTFGLAVDGGGRLNVSNGGVVNVGARTDLDADGIININAGGSYTTTRSLIAGQPEATRQRTINVNAGTYRNNGDTTVHLQFTGTGAPPVSSGVVNFNVTNGGTYSTGHLNNNTGAPAAGTTQTTNFLVDGTGSVFEARNSTTFGNSYMSFGFADLTAANGSIVNNITVRNNGIMRAVDDDAAGGAFINLGDGNGQVTNVNVESGGFLGTNQAAGRGGSMSIGTGNLASQTTVNVGSTTSNQSVIQCVGSPDGTGAGGAQLQIGTGAYGGIDGTDSVVTVNVTSGGKFFAGPSVTSFVAIDYDSVVNLNVSGTGTMDLGTFVSFGGGNSTTTAGSPVNTGGTTNLTISNGGTFVVDGMALARDYGDINFPAEKIVTNITVTGAGSTLTLDGTDDTATAGIDDGFFTTSIGATGSVLTSDLSEITVNVQNGGKIKAGEASFLGDTKNGFTVVNVSGAGSEFDSSRQLSVNDDALENSVATFNITGGGVLKTSSSAAQATGSMFFGTSAATATGTQTTINVTGAGSKLESSGSISLGASIVSSNLVDGTAVTLNAGAGTTVSASSTGSFLVGSTSTVSTAGTVNVGNIASAGVWTVNGGSFTSSSLQLIGAGELRVTPTNALAPVLIKTGNLTIGATSLVELHKNAIQITPGGTTPTTLDGVKTFITTAGFGGIKSSDLTANTALGLALVETAGTFLGSPTAVGDILVRYTLLGDATLDGTVNFDDLLKLAANYNTASKYWYQGDFTNDGNVNFDDLLKLAANYNTSLTGSFGGDWALAQSAVPEPTSLLAVGLGGAALLGRRRRR